MSFGGHVESIIDTLSDVQSLTSGIRWTGNTGIKITGRTFTGGISNAGTISASGDAAIRVADSAVSFSGGSSTPAH